MFANFGGRSAKVNSKVQIFVRLRHFDQAKRVEKSPRKRPYISLLSYYVIARSDLLCRAVAIPRKGTLCALVKIGAEGTGRAPTTKTDAEVRK